ncbi:MAG: UDP-N-acetylmuramoyl-L-alanyl-D-glutamate--2,6-diaminopimelate ligase [Actinomycetota bacterium]|nr:UDP-N-acetylmuramoyl-L-alanyl-D-glutamate--2,6-diaminopimelate ligase [Actinomycetota bacterium]
MVHTVADAAGVLDGGGFKEAEILLSELLRKAGVDAREPLAADPEVTSISFDSRKVRPGSLFVALTGRHFDGAAFAGDALSRGAVAVLGDPASLRERIPRDFAVGADAPDRALLADLALALYGDVSAELSLVGVTGTNGKTTVTHLISHIASRSGHRASVIGTLNGERTTPEAAELFERLAARRDAGEKVVALEVSSIALDQERTRNLRFAVAVFTNLSPDHLDYHGTMESYFAAKARLFVPGVSEFAVINRDSPYGARLISDLGIPGAGYGLADACEATFARGEATFLLRGRLVRVPLFGRHNLYNVLAAIAAAERLGVPFADCAEAVSDFPGVPGRLERVNPGGSPAVYVDYAHSPDALDQVTRALRAVMEPGGRLIAVFGAGGNRDRTKRALMGAVIGAAADYAVVTNDNPRDEDPELIAAEIVSGFSDARGGFGSEIVYDRAEAIGRAIALAGPDDVVVIAGKGHETYQITGGVTRHFSDQETARSFLGLTGESRP